MANVMTSNSNGIPRWPWLAAGVLAIVGGIAALLNPMAATVAAERIAGFVFLLVGALQLIDFFVAEKWSGRIVALLLAVVLIVLGVDLLTEPMRGVLALTFTVAILFLVSGAAKIALAFGSRATSFFWPVLLSGAISALLGLMILARFPDSAAVTLGILLGVDLISTGLSFVTIWVVLKQLAGKVN